MASLPCLCAAGGPAHSTDSPDRCGSHGTGTGFLLSLVEGLQVSSRCCFRGEEEETLLWYLFMTLAFDLIDPKI
ncbi:hypothetical protein EYF80_045305 [Liparis tanakae]|uniref:Uncharacterized protein n=1 Tax=Liparis tanakae TaxID=230148 RepID=A0A4Z2FUK9_9TELE|nr:hypothetical protein EYF80_045305 [Liparis tanakae]